MEEKPRSTRNLRNARGKGFYIAMYSSLAGLLVLAIAIGYYNFIGFGGITGETPVTVTSQEDLWQTEIDNLPVGSNWDVPVAAQPGDQPAPQRQGLPPSQPNNEGARDGAPRPTPSPQAEAPTPTPVPSPTPEGDDDDWDLSENGEIHLGEDDADIYNVFDPAQSPQTFAHFTENDSMHWPILGDIVMDFAMDRLIYDATLDQWRTNDSVAIAASSGDSVRAAASGIIKDITESRQFGQTVVIDHGNGWLTTYSQLDPDVVVNIGDVVSRGQIIGSVGSPSIFGSLLGYHVNFAITNNETPIDPNTLLTTTH